MSRRFALVPLSWLLWLSLTARAQYDDAAIAQVSAPQLNPQGRPSGGLASSPLSYAVWNADDGWHLRANAGSQPTRFSGSIGAPFGVSGARALSADLPLQVSATGIAFNFL